MPERKQTPDILAEVLGGGTSARAAAAPETLPAPPVTIPRTPTRPERAARSKTQPVKKESMPARQAWEYKAVSFQEYKGWRPRFINGQELKEWMSQPVMHDYLNQMGSDGWELVAASSGTSLYGILDRFQLYFKRLSNLP